MTEETEPAITLPPNHKVLGNGAIYEYDAGRIVANVGGKPTTAINQSNAVAMNVLNREKSIRAAQRAIVEGTKAKGLYGGLTTLHSAMVRVALDPEQFKRASVEAYRAVLNSAGLTIDHDNASSNNIHDNNITLVLAGDLFARLFDNRE
jgi:hypothetical protein